MLRSMVYFYIYTFRSKEEEIIVVVVPRFPTFGCYSTPSRGVALRLDDPGISV